MTSLLFIILLINIISIINSTTVMNQDKPKPPKTIKLNIDEPSVEDKDNRQKSKCSEFMDSDKIDDTSKPNQKSSEEKKNSAASTPNPKTDTDQHNPTSEFITSDILKIEKLKTWMLDSDPPKTKILDSLYPQYKHNSEYRGLASNKKIYKNQNIVTIYPDKFISSSFAGNELQKIFGLSFSKIKFEMGNFTDTAIFLLYEETLGSSSKWKYWFDTLPKKFDSGFVQTFTDSERQMISKSALLRYTDNRLHSIQKDYDQLCLLLEQTKLTIAKKFSFERFFYWMTAINSRDFNADFGDNQADLLIIPYLDLMNHSNKENLRYGWDNHLQAFTAYADKDIEPNQELFFNYGQSLDNSEYQLFYGFFPEDNDHKNMMRFVIDQQEWSHLPLYQKKREFLAKKDLQFLLHNQMMKINTDNFKVDQDGGMSKGQSDNFISTKKAMWFLRFISIDNDSDLQTHNVNFVPSWNENGPVSIYGEIKMFQFFEGLCLNRLNGYETTMEQDVNKLQKAQYLDKDKFTVNEVWILKFLIAEKRILKSMLKFTELMIVALSGSTPEVLFLV